MNSIFAIGVNYWDSRSGTDMWRNWSPETVEADLAALEAVGVRWASRRFGVGVSLYSGEPTLLERVGGATYERESRRVSAVYRRLVERAQRAHQSP